MVQKIGLDKSSPCK